MVKICQILHLWPIFFFGRFSANSYVNFIETHCQGEPLLIRTLYADTSCIPNECIKVITSTTE